MTKEELGRVMDINMSLEIIIRRLINNKGQVLN